MRCYLWVIPLKLFPLNRKSSADNFYVDDLYKVHKCCGERCNKYKKGVFEIKTDDADNKMPYKERIDRIGSWSLNYHGFAELDNKTNGLLRAIVGEYEERRCIRLFHKREQLKQLRAIADSMEEGHYKSFLTILLDFAEDALEKYGVLVAISNA